MLVSDHPSDVLLKYLLSRNEACGSIVSQTSKKMTKKELTRELAALKADVAKLKAEMASKVEVASLKADLAHLKAEEKVKFKDEMANLNKKMHAELDAIKASGGPKAEEKKIKGKVQAFEEKAAKATEKAKATVETKIADAKAEAKKVASDAEGHKEAKTAS